MQIAHLNRTAFVLTYRDAGREAARGGAAPLGPLSARVSQRSRRHSCCRCTPQFTLSSYECIRVVCFSPFCCSISFSYSTFQHEKTQLYALTAECLAIDPFSPETCFVNGTTCSPLFTSKVNVNFLMHSELSYCSEDVRRSVESAAARLTGLSARAAHPVPSGARFSVGRGARTCHTRVARERPLLHGARERRDGAPLLSSRHR